MGLAARSGLRHATPVGHSQPAASSWARPGHREKQAPSEVLRTQKNTKAWAVSAKGTLCSIKLKSVLNEGCSVISCQTYVFIVDVKYWMGNHLTLSHCGCFFFLKSFCLTCETNAVVAPRGSSLGNPSFQLLCGP